MWVWESCSQCLNCRLAEWAAVTAVQPNNLTLLIKDSTDFCKQSHFASNPTWGHRGLCSLSMHVWVFPAYHLFSKLVLLGWLVTTASWKSVFLFGPLTLLGLLLKFKANPSWQFLLQSPASLLLVYTSVAFLLLLSSPKGAHSFMNVVKLAKICYFFYLPKALVIF